MAIIIFGQMQDTDHLFVYHISDPDHKVIAHVYFHNGFWSLYRIWQDNLYFRLSFSAKA